MRKFKVGTAGIGQRADVFITSKYPEFARSALATLFDNELVEIDGKTAKPSQKLCLNDQVVVDDRLIKSQPEAIELPVLYEDDAVVVIDKPSGLLTHSKGALNLEPSVASFLSGKITDKNLKSNRAGIVHRLDRPTSGVIIGAKTSASMSYLQKQFADRKTAKTYLAIVEGVPEPTEAIIDAPIERNPRRSQSFRVGADGKPAQTRYKVQETFEKAGKSYSMLELKPVTGRTHQLRVHLSYIGHPVVGDHVYGHEGPVLLLHAAELGITLPDGQKKIFTAVTPKRFEEFKQP